MKRTYSINLARMVKKHPTFALAPLFLAVLAGCGEGSSSAPTMYASNVDTCDGMDSREKVTQCEAAYYKALNTAEKDRPRFTTMAECEQLYGRCEKPSDGSSFLVPALTGYVIASMMHDLGDSFRDRGRYYREEYRRRDYEFNTPVYVGGGYTGSSQSTSPSKGYQAPNKPKPKAAPPPKPKPAAPASSGGFGSTASAKKNWGGSSGSGASSSSSSSGSWSSGG